MGEIIGKYRLNGVQVVKFENTNSNTGQKFNSYKISKTFKDENNEWKDSNSFNTTDLLALKHILDNHMNGLIRSKVENEAYS